MYNKRQKEKTHYSKSQTVESNYCFRRLPLIFITRDHRLHSKQTLYHRYRYIKLLFPVLYISRLLQSIHLY